MILMYIVYHLFSLCWEQMSYSTFYQDMSDNEYEEYLRVSFTGLLRLHVFLTWVLHLMVFCLQSWF